MAKLSQRLEALLALITPGNVLCDVGTDHGFVPIELCQRGISQRAIAMDLRKGPLERAREHIADAGFENEIATRLSDGVEALAVGEADTILIAGMGGEVMLHILRNGNTVCHSVKELILQPQSEIDEVRRYLREEGYQIVEEDMVLEDGKYYPMMRVVPVTAGQTQQKEHTPELEKLYDTYGPMLLRNQNQVLLSYVTREHEMYVQLQQSLALQEQTQKVLLRLQQVKEELAKNEKALALLKK